MAGVESKISLPLRSAEAAFKDAPPGVRPATLGEIVFVSTRDDARKSIPHTKLLTSIGTTNFSLVASTESSSTPGLSAKIGSTLVEVGPGDPIQTAMDDVRAMLTDKYDLRREAEATMLWIKGSEGLPFVAALNEWVVFDKAPYSSYPGKHIQLSISSSFAKQNVNTHAEFGFIAPDEERERLVTPGTAQEFLNGVATLYDDIRETAGVTEQVPPVIARIVYREPVIFLSDEASQGS